MKRIFIAIDISEEARRKVSNYIESLQKEFPKLRVGWEKAEKLHLTMKFLGDTSEVELQKLTEAVEITTQKVSEFNFQNSDFRFQIAETGVFPTPRKARVLWLGLTDEKGILTKINEILEEKCEKAGFAKENRKFKPHLTIARLREPRFSGKLVEKHLQNEFEPVEFEVSEIVIYESKLQPSRSIYSKVSSFKLF